MSKTRIMVCFLVVGKIIYHPPSHTTTPIQHKAPLRFHGEGLARKLYEN